MSVFVVVLLNSCKKQEADKSNRPNILFIMSDDHTSQTWGIYGGILNDYVQNKNIERLANEGAVLNNSFCTNSICTPSRASILTGKYSHKNGVYTLRDPFEPDSLNIAKVLQNNGYSTAIIGKWHLKKKPSGFDYFNILLDQGRYWDPILRTAENFDKPQGHWDIHKGFSTDVITDLSINYLDSINKDRPFMLMTHFKATHEPFYYPKRHENLYKNIEIPEPKTLFDFNRANGRTFSGRDLDNMAWRMENATKNPEHSMFSYPGEPFVVDGLDSIAKRKYTYQKMVKDFMRSAAAIDDNIGRLLDYLETSGLAENTVVIYTADQGYFLGEHGFFDKRLIYEESLRMPFVIRYPEEIPAGQRIDDLILNIDFAALFADYADAKLPKDVQGKSFRNILKGEKQQDWRQSIYYRYWMHEPYRPGHFGIRNHQYKLALFYGKPLDKKGASKEITEPAWEFFDLKNDPQENNNAYNNPKYKNIIAEMKTELIRQRKLLGDTDETYPEIQKLLHQ
ncbi:arylsulfatase A-like enzyme [Flavobacteriaceae bacterium MAR_2010_72]|nr:arylsulfatase A-like enzyme [Flavobacteriaceae bacterium MAR_2010_72]